MAGSSGTAGAGGAGTSESAAAAATTTAAIISSSSSSSSISSGAYNNNSASGISSAAYNNNASISISSSAYNNNNNNPSIIGISSSAYNNNDNNPSISISSSAYNNNKINPSSISSGRMSDPMPPPPPSSSPPCAACKFLRRKCAAEACVFAPYFPADSPQRFVHVHRVFGASNAAKLLQEVPAARRDDAASSLAYEAEARVRDPVHGCVGTIALLQAHVARLQCQLAAARRLISSHLLLLRAHAAHPHHHYPHIDHHPAAAVGSSTAATSTPDHHHHHHHHHHHQSAAAAAAAALTISTPHRASTAAVLQYQPPVSCFIRSPISSASSPPLFLPYINSAAFPNPAAAADSAPASDPPVHLYAGHRHPAAPAAYNIPHPHDDDHLHSAHPIPAALPIFPADHQYRPPHDQLLHRPDPRPAAAAYNEHNIPTRAEYLNPGGGGSSSSNFRPPAAADHEYPADTASTGHPDQLPAVSITSQHDRLRQLQQYAAAAGQYHAHGMQMLLQPSSGCCCCSTATTPSSACTSGTSSASDHVSSGAATLATSHVDHPPRQLDLQQQHAADPSSGPIIVSQLISSSVHTSSTGMNLGASPATMKPWQDHDHQ